MSQAKRRFKRSSSNSLSEVRRPEAKKPNVRRPTVYDAVAGKVAQYGFINTKTFEQQRANKPLRPDEVLFKKINAPTRYEETDYYFAHKKLRDNQKLPDGDLLNALHSYVSKLYERTQMPGQKMVWKCMDETALIALGVLMEEMAKETLGETGDLALLEAARSEEEGEDKNGEKKGKKKGKGKGTRNVDRGSTQHSRFRTAYFVESDDGT